MRLAISSQAHISQTNTFSMSENKPPQPIRDTNLDTFRGFAMMYVIFIHCLYWLYLFHNANSITYIKSFFLIEMPLLFFITGASNSMGRKKSLLTFYISRFQRILIPYWIYCIICTILIVLTFGFT